MKVKDLIKALSGFDQELDVLCHCEDPAIAPKGTDFRVFEIAKVSINEAERTRISGNVPSLKFGPGEAAKNLVLLDVEADF